LIILAAMAFRPSGVIESILPIAWRADAEYEKHVAVTGLVGACFIFYVLARLQLFERLFGVSAKAAARAITMCAVFFCAYVAMAMIFAHCLPASLNAPSATTMGLVYLIAWLAGFVVPGAPGGLGVREAMLVLLLTDAGETGRALALGLGFGMRIVSTLGDVIAVGLAYALARLSVRYDAGRIRKAGCIQ
jgi:uncharacterized membrane protein YbhN (UPF0104 family)